MGTRERRLRSDEYDALLSSLVPDNVSGFAIAAVGSYGRGELAPGSDLDIVFLHDGIRTASELTELINSILYPLWNRKIKVDHSVRTLDEACDAMESDIKVIIGLLHIRLITGEPELVAEVHLQALTTWRRDIDKYFPWLEESLEQRHRQSGELAYLLEPDIKEARGGLRDITALRALTLADSIAVPIERISQAEATLWRIREALHEVNGKGKDRLLFQEQDSVALALGYADADALMADIAQAARSVDYVLQVTRHRYHHQSAHGIRAFFKKTKSSPVSKGLNIVNNEIVIDPTYDYEADPVIGLRAAATAAQLGLPLSIDSLEQYSKSLQEGRGILPEPWPREAREYLISLIGAGEAMVEIFEALDQEEILFNWIPEWRAVRSLPQRNALHRHTVDRHMVETAVAAAALTREVHRPDILLFTSLFHDIGKGTEDDHSLRGKVLIAPIAARIGFSDSDIASIQTLIEHHLLLSSTATRRDLDDPATIASVVDAIHDVRTLELLHALSIADGEATGKAAWSEWKASLVRDLVERTRRALTDSDYEAQPEFTLKQVESAMNGNLSVSLENRGPVLAIELIIADRTGVLSLIAGVLNILRLDVRAARTKTLGTVAVMEWIVSPDPNAPEVTREVLADTLTRALDGDIDIESKIAARIAAYAQLPSIPVPAPTVETFLDAATDATVIEVRSHDRPALLYGIGGAVADCGIDIRAAIVTTLGAEAIDTLYVTEIGGGALTPERALEVESRLSASLK